MRTNSRFRLLAAFGGTVAAAATMTMLASAATPKFYADDPIVVERDSADASSMQRYEPDLLADFVVDVFTRPGDPNTVRAMNVNSVDEVPDSSWFTNRVGGKSITPEQMAVGPDTTDGPEAGAWRVSSSKSDGVTPGLTIKDAKAQTWFIKFDPRGYRGMATGTEVAVTKLMWALGYNVPENHVAYLRREQLVVGSGATYTGLGGKRRPMKGADIDALLARADRQGDGSYRVVASKALPGTPVGRIRFYNTRPDDPNDLVSHEHRRELRGYGTFAAWLNHVDAKSINSLDMLVKENGKSVVRHHLIDFGSALGSGALQPAEPWAGREYAIQGKQTLLQMAAFGFYMPKWHTAKFYESRSIGRLPVNNGNFEPDAWKPTVPNQAFLRAQADDKFWAAQKLVALTDPLIRAAVRTGDFQDPASEEFLVKALEQRRDAIGRTYLNAINPIADPALDAAGMLTFRNAAVDADFAKAPQGYRAVWSRFDNATNTAVRIAETSGRTTALQAPEELLRQQPSFVKVEISSIGAAIASWEKPVHAYFRAHNGVWQLVGFERVPRL
ncbi:MAG: hypothetical protein ABI652_03155 [Acidobacteriota bacterium]